MKCDWAFDDRNTWLELNTKSSRLSFLIVKEIFSINRSEAKASNMFMISGAHYQIHIIMYSEKVNSTIALKIQIYLI